MLFQVPRLSDPMFVCYDLAVEKEFHPVILGLGDVIIPGYLISFCFTVDFAIVTRHMYGIVSIAGYGVGLFVTFAALTLMETAQPALIYLIPFTLLPVVVLALIRRELKILWTGEFVNHNIDGVTASESTTVQIDAELGSTLSLNWNEHR
ncbi:hypothetical protein AB6A40_011177 [Gnathostoma spinigerum]|uniref:Signal peptide peptidase-like 2B n=1 Tax=Gnathostoma spinigerum TaxID=75299 RepID=A0ABD6EXG5_9BILA